METTGSRIRVPRGRRASRRTLRGQALVLFLMFLGVLVIGVVLLFNTGQAVNKKVRLVHAADAAAYSVAVQQARAMNFAAYMNRSRVANEVAIAQMISLGSWLNMMHSHAWIGMNLFTYLSAVPYVNIVAIPLSRIYQGFERVIAAVRGGAIPGIRVGVGGVDFLNGVLATAADAMLQIGTRADGILIARSVVTENDPQAELAPAGYAVLIGQLAQAAATGEHGLLDRHAPRGRQRVDGMDRFRNVVMASRDEFTAERRDRLGFIIEFEERGGTDMVDYDRWSAIDTIDLEIDLFLFEMSEPLGYGGMQSLPSGRRDFMPGIRSGGRNRNGNGWYAEYHSGRPTYGQYGGATHSTARNRAARYPSVNTPMWVRWHQPQPATNVFRQHNDAFVTGYQGLRPYYDVQQDVARSPQPGEGNRVGPLFSVYVQSGREHARTSEDIDGIGAIDDSRAGIAGSSLSLDNQMNDDKLTAISSAEVYFNRPPRDRDGAFRRLVPQRWNGTPTDDRKLEMGSLFSPYWQARLVETPGSVYAAVGLSALIPGA